MKSSNRNHRSIFSPAKIAIASAAVSLSACGPGSKAKTADAVIPATGRVEVGSLGFGWNKKKENFTGQCLKGSLIYSGAQNGGVNWKRVTESGQMQSKLGFELNAKARYGTVTASAAAQFAQSASSSAYSEVLLYSNEIQFKNAILSDIELTPIGKSLVSKNAAGQLMPLDNFEETCGHEFVQQLVLGAALYMSVRIDFATEQEKEDFQAEFSVRQEGIGELAGRLEAASQKASSRASVTVSVFQLGGDPSRVATAMGATNSSGGSAIVRCSISDLESCTKAIDGIAKYGTDGAPDADSFPNQLKKGELAENSPKGPAVISYVTKSYSAAGINPPNEFIAAGVKESRNSLFNEFEKQLKFRTRLDVLSRGGIRLSQAQSLKVTEASNTVNANIAILVAAGSLCYQDLEGCTANASAAIAQVNPIDESVFSVVFDSYAQYCDAAKVGGQRIDLAVSVAKLNEFAQSKLQPLTKNQDACAEYENILVEETRINFPGAGISDLRPFGTLRNLETLMLENNQIVNLEPLSNLPKLKMLVVDQNSVSNLAPLLKIKSLEDIFVNSNEQISFDEIEKLKELPNLFSIEADIGTCIRRENDGVSCRIRRF